MSDCMNTFNDSRLPAHRALYLGGAWQPASSGRFIDVECPSTGQSLGRVPHADVDDVARAVASARAGFNIWRDVPAQERANAVRAAANVIRQHAEELAWLDAVDCGIAYQAMLHDAMVSADYMDYFAGLVTEIKGSTIPVGRGVFNYTLREPLGVVARIGPCGMPCRSMKSWSSSYRFHGLLDT